MDPPEPDNRSLPDPPPGPLFPGIYLLQDTNINVRTIIMANLINVWKGKKKKLIFANMSSRGFDCLRWIFKNTFYRKKVAFFVGVVTYTFIQRR